MAKKKQLEPPHDSMPNMTAMVDLVMCILIFFMLGSKFIQPETFLPSSMPVDLGFGAASKSNDINVPLILDLKRGGGLGVVVNLPEGNTNKQITAPSERPRDEKESRKMLKEYMKRVTAVLEARKQQLAGKIRVIIRPTADLEYQYVAGVFGACLDAKFDNIAFAISVGETAGSSVLP
jgi:biopolymer transport protein ExbD